MLAYTFFDHTLLLCTHLANVMYYSIQCERTNWGKTTVYYSHANPSILCQIIIQRSMYFFQNKVTDISIFIFFFIPLFIGNIRLCENLFVHGITSGNVLKYLYSIFLIEIQTFCNRNEVISKDESFNFITKCLFLMNRLIFSY